MNRLFLLILLIFFSSTLTHAQTSYYFINNKCLDTISHYRLKLYFKSDVATYLPNKNNAIILYKKNIEKADSIILYFDYWYREKIHKTEFDNNTIYINRQIYLDEVIVKKETKTIGTFHKKLRGITPYAGSGELISFQLEQPSKIKALYILIDRNKVEYSTFVPVLFMADSIDDPNKIYLYPKGKLITIEEKFRKEWVNIPIKEYSGTMKSQIFAGYIAKSSNIIFGTARAKTNTFLEDYFGSIYTVGKMWEKEYVYRIEDFYVPAVKIELEK